MADDHRTGRHHADLAEKDVDAITDPARWAGVNATLALAHALLAVGEDTRGINQPLLELQEAVRYGR
ncbi:hypothetical protein ABZ729_06765 [Streptomyces sp. NPDC006678]|uniref:hypothetical protein n=1 Tax=Streptomyces sp. NPDC006678 TaxID=3157185 RepID=UPI0033DD6701